MKSKKFKLIKKIALLSIIAYSLNSCASIKEYEKVNINDPDMELSQRQICRFETNFQLYREGSSGANGGKVGGGCGCN
ncbi:DUF4266 domain-containing protein [Flavobacteriaceae bacterium]|nr:DUF4266 domain-containing protein [Flavobacteriaceae bacterium]